MTLEIKVLDRDRREVASVGEYLELVCELRKVGVSTWLLKLVARDRWLDLFTPGSGLLVRRDGRHLISGRMLNPGLAWSAEGDDTGLGTLTLVGVGDKAHIAHRVARPNPALAPEAQDRAVDKRTGPAETLILGYVNDNAGPAARPERRIRGLEVGTDLGRGPTLTRRAAGDVVLELVDDRTADMAGLVTEVVPSESPGGRLFRAYEPADLTGTVRFSRGLGNLRGLQIHAPAPGVTHPLVAGGPEDARIYREFTPGPGADEWDLRIERFVDAGTATGEDELLAAHEEAIAEGAPGGSVSFAAVDTQKIRFGHTYNLGDQVTVELARSVAGVVQVRGAIRELRYRNTPKEGETVQPFVGPVGSTDPRHKLRPSRQARRLLRRIGALERRI